MQSSFAVPAVTSHARQLEKKSHAWFGSGAFGFNMNTGNTRTKNANAELILNYQHAPWLHQLDVDGQLNYNKGKRSAMRYNAKLENNYFFKSKQFVFGDIAYGRDKFNPIAATFLIAGGFGQRLLKTKQMQLDLRFGPGYKILSPANNDEDIRQIVIYNTTEYQWQINPEVTFVEKFDVNSGRANTNLLSNTALNVTLIHDLGLQIAYRVNYNSLIPSGSKNTRKIDTTTNVSVVYHF